MPVIDTELVQPLTAITDTLRRRPGVANMQSIKKLSETYGFTTFVEHIRSETGGNIIRMSISGHVLLIDIDFKIPAHLEAGLGSPMSPSAASGSLLGEFSGLDRTNIIHVSISSAITPDLIDGVNWDFLVGFGGSDGSNVSCSDVLYDNLAKEKTMDAFNKNLRVLLQFDRLSGTKPFDLFTIFSELACGLTKQIQLDETGDSIEKNDGVIGLGKVLCNYGGKVGLFLKYWVDDRFVNRWIRENRKVEVDEQEYLLHFKVRESLKKDDEDEKEVKEEKHGDSEMDVDTAVNSTRLFNVDFGEWNVEKGSKIEDCLSNVILELCPPVWVPEDLLLEFGVEYETIVPGRFGNYSADRVDEVYSAVNETGEYNCKEGKVKVSMLVGCPMLLVHKTTLGDLNQLQGFVQSLRTWCKVASLLRKLPNADIDGTATVEVSCLDVKRVTVAVAFAFRVDRTAIGGTGSNGGERSFSTKRSRDLRFSISVAEGEVLFPDERCGEKEGGEEEGGESGGARTEVEAERAVRAVELTETLFWKCIQDNHRTDTDTEFEY